MGDLWHYLPYAIGFVVIVITSIGLFAGRHVYKAITNRKAPDYDVEDAFKRVDGTTGTFPSIDDKPSVLVSIVVPAYNEEARITPMLDEMLDYIKLAEKADSSFTWEIIVVDDGSKDSTSAFVFNHYVKKYGTDRFRVLTLFKNNGKGGAVRKGMVRARGRYVLMADADGATKASDLGRLLAEVKKVEQDGLGIAIGSRAHMEEAEGEAKAKRSPLRKVLMWGFHTLIDVMIGSSKIKDTQCGFKLFSRDAARLLFPVQHIDRWAFDVELIFLAARHNIPMVEVPVTWNEIDGSKLDVISSSIQMARDIFAIRVAYMLGAWKTHREPAVILSATTGKQLSAASVPASLATGIDALNEAIPSPKSAASVSKRARVGSPRNGARK